MPFLRNWWLSKLLSWGELNTSLHQVEDSKGSMYCRHIAHQHIIMLSSYSIFFRRCSTQNLFGSGLKQNQWRRRCVWARAVRQVSTCVLRGRLWCPIPHPADDGPARVAQRLDCRFYANRQTHSRHLRKIKCWILISWERQPSSLLSETTTGVGLHVYLAEYGFGSKHFIFNLLSRK